jgi:hypothetical protein
MLTAADFLADYPEFGAVNADPTVASTIVTRFLALADAFLSDGAFGTLRDHALGLYTAHRLAVRFKTTLAGLQPQGSPGTVTSQNASTSGLAVTRQPPAAAGSEQAWKADLSRTNYGLEYLALLDACIGPGRITEIGSGGATDQGITTNAGMPVPGFP